MPWIRPVGLRTSVVLVTLFTRPGRVMTLTDDVSHRMLSFFYILMRENGLIYWARYIDS